MTPSPTQSNIQAALRSFLLSVLPAGVDVIAGQINRVAEPRAGDFVVLTPSHFKRLRTNQDSFEDVKFTGSIAGTVLTVTDVDFGVIEIGATVFGVGVAANTLITALGSGTGGVGTYTVSVSQTISEEELSSGAKTVEQGVQVTVQLDFHSASLSSAGDMAQTFSTLFRDEYATTQFANQEPNYGVVPLWSEDPHQAPFISETQQWEWRWIAECLLQANVIVSVPQEFCDSIEVTLIDVDAEFPP